MVRHGYGEMIRVGFVTEANVASTLPNDTIADALQGFDDLTARHYRQLGAHTATATLLTRVLDMSGIGWSWACMSSRHS